jgi:hypothetical protein
MKRTRLGQIRERLEPRLNPQEGTGILEAGPFATILALMRVAAWDESFPAEVLRAQLDRRTQEAPGLLAEYRRAVALLDGAAERLFGDVKFADLGMDERNAVLQKLLRQYPFGDRLPAWRWRFRLTSDNLDVLLSRGAQRRFRRFVLRDLLSFYYATTSGWQAVGYGDQHPGHVREELFEASVVAVHTLDDGDVLFELSDGTYERAGACTLQLDPTLGVVLLAKAGRQRVRFSRLTYQRVLELADEVDGDIVLHFGAHTIAVGAEVPT